MVQVKFMTVKQFMEAECDNEKLEEMYDRIDEIPKSKWAARLTYGEKPLYMSGNNIYGGGDCISILSHRKGYGYTLIHVGDRGEWSCGVHAGEKIPKDAIAFYDGEFEAVFESLAKHFA